MNNPTNRALPVADVVLGVLMIVVGVAAFISVSDLKTSALEPIGPSAFPFAVSIILVGLALAVLILAVRGTDARPPSGAFRRRIDLVLVTLGLTAAYFLAMQLDWLSFRWATAVYVGLLTAALSDWHPRRFPAAVGLGLVTGLGLQFVFTKVLFLDLP